MPERVIGRNLDQDDPDAVGVLELHLDQAPRLGYRFPHNWDPGCGQPGVLGVNIADLEPDHHRVPGRVGRVPGDLEQSLAEEEHQPGIVRRAELPVNGQAEDISVEAAAAVQVTRAQQDPAAQNVHATIPASRRATREARENTRSAADLSATISRPTCRPSRTLAAVLLRRLANTHRWTHV
jgi:hypothetical protein